LDAETKERERKGETYRKAKRRKGKSSTRLSKDNKGKKKKKERWRAFPRAEWRQKNGLGKQSCLREGKKKKGRKC